MSPPPSLPQLVEDLRDLAARHGAPAKDTTLTAASTAALFLGVDPATGGPLLRALAGSPDLAAGLLRIWGRKDGVMPKKIDPAVKERVVPRVLEQREEYTSLTAAARAVAKVERLGTETVRRWVFQAETDAGLRPGTT